MQNTHKIVVFVVVFYSFTDLGQVNNKVEPIWGNITVRLNLQLKSMR